MIKTITTFAFAFVLFVSTIYAQETPTFEQKMKTLSTQIDVVVATEKKLLKQEIKAIEKEYNQDKITFEEAKAQKEKATQLHANNIKQETEKIEEKIHDLVQGKVNVKVKEVDSRSRTFTFDWNTIRKDSVYKYKRTFSGLVVAFGFNNLIKDGDLNTINDSDFKFSNSRFLELGRNYKTRIFKNNSLFYVNYGMSLRYNTLIAKDNKYLVINGNQTNLETFNLDLKKSKFRNLQFVVPVSFELDFSKPKQEENRIYYRRNNSWRIAFGGFAGINLKSKQILKYKEDGRLVRQKIKKDYNVNRFVYGVQGQIGYENTSFYVKYDLQDTFTHSFTGQKNISFGVRFDW